MLVLFRSPPIALEDQCVHNRYDDVRRIPPPFNPGLAPKIELSLTPPVVDVHRCPEQRRHGKQGQWECGGWLLHGVSKNRREQHNHSGKGNAGGEFEQMHDRQRFGSMPFRVLDQELVPRSEEHTSELQSLMRISYAVFCLKKKKSNRHI